MAENYFTVLTETIKTLQYSFATMNNQMNSPFLRHYQGESKPFAAAVSQHADDQIHLPNINMDWSELSRFNYSTKMTTGYLADYDIANVGELSLESNYTLIPEKVCLIGFWVLLALEVFLLMIAKRLSNPLSFKRQSWLEIFTNCSESSQIPTVFEDWDDVHGPIESYKRAQRKVEHEMGWTLMVNLIMNLLKCVPMIILGNTHLLSLLIFCIPNLFSHQCAYPTNGFGAIHWTHA